MRRFNADRLVNAKADDKGRLTYFYKHVGQGVVFDNKRVAVSIADTEAAFDSIDQAIAVLGIAVKFIDDANSHEYNAALGRVG